MGSFTLDTRTQFNWVILGRKNSPLDKDFDYYYKILKEWCDGNCKTYAFLGHDKDLDDDGSPKFRHIHLLAVYKDIESGNYPRLKTTLLRLSKALKMQSQDIDIQVAEDADKCIRYCCHIGYPLKYQYSPISLNTNLSKQELDAVINLNEEDKSVSTEYLLTCIKINKCSTIAILRTLGLKKYMKYRNVIKDVKDEILRGL